MTIKYIVYMDSDRFEKFITFDDFTNHSDFRDIGRILGAGFVRITSEIVDDLEEFRSYTEKYECYGESISLGIKSRNEKDSKILNGYIE